MENPEAIPTDRTEDPTAPIKVETRTLEKAAEIDRKLGFLEWYGEALPAQPTIERK